MANENGARLQIVPSNPSPEAKSPSGMDLLAIAMELGVELTLQELDHPESKLIRNMLEQIFTKREVERLQAESERQEREKLEQLQAKLKKLSGAAHDLLHPPQEVVQLTRADIAKMAGPREPTLGERLTELKGKYGTKFPSCIFDPETHEPVMALRGHYIRRKLELQTMRHGVSQTERGTWDNAIDCLQGRIDLLSEIARVGYQIDPTDKANYSGHDAYAMIQELALTDPQIQEHLKAPKSAAQVRDEQAAAEKAKAEEQAKQAARLAEREKMTAAILTCMARIEYFQKMGEDARNQVANRVARKFSGSTPESRLKQAAREKCGGDVKRENRLLGVALAQAAKCTPDEVRAMFPDVKEKKEKKK